MNEPKMCPMAFIGLTCIDNKVIGPFAMCIQEKCTWWIANLKTIKTYGVHEWEQLRTAGQALGDHCAIVDLTKSDYSG